jgi:hypothetical protein
MDRPEYKAFYHKSLKEGRHVLLDNSLYELGKHFNTEQYFQGILELQPTEFILPDVMNDMEGTMTAAAKFFDDFGDQIPIGYHGIIGVVQGKTYPEIRRCYKYLEAIGCDKIAISFGYDFYLTEWKNIEDCRIDLLGNNLDTNSSRYDTFTDLELQYIQFKNIEYRKMLGRISLMNRLADDGILGQTPLHLLGCALPQEFRYYARDERFKNLIETIDTSNPIVAGIYNQRYEEQGLRYKQSVKLDHHIDDILTSNQLKDIMYNVGMFRKLIS